MTLDNLGWFIAGYGSGLIVFSAIFLTVRLIASRRQKKFEKFLDDLKAMGEEAIKQQDAATFSSQKHVSKLTFRDKTGTLCTVEIIIDPDLPNELPDKGELTKMVREGTLGTVQDMIKGKHVGAMDDVQKFVFSAQTVQQMREQGIEPDEMVRRMLKASGRIA